MHAYFRLFYDSMFKPLEECQTCPSACSPTVVSTNSTRGNDSDRSSHSHVPYYFEDEEEDDDEEDDVIILSDSVSFPKFIYTPYFFRSYVALQHRLLYIIHSHLHSMYI